MTEQQKVRTVSNQETENILSLGHARNVTLGPAHATASILTL